MGQELAKFDKEHLEMIDAAQSYMEKYRILSKLPLKKIQYIERVFRTVLQDKEKLKQFNESFEGL